MTPITAAIQTSKFILLTLCIACTSPYHTQNQYLPKYQTGKLQEAECSLKKIITQEMSERSFVQSRNAVWYLLNLATIEFARGNIKEAISTYHLALNALDYYAQPSSDDLTAQLVLEDQYSGFTGFPYEQTLARLYFSLALIQNGDMNNAEAVLRETEEKQLFPNPLCKYLFAHLLAKRSDISNAKILCPQIEITTKPQVIVLCHNGSTPIKVSAIAPASDASLVALELFLQGNKRPFALSSIPGIQVPMLATYPNSYPRCIFASINHVEKPLNCYYNIAKDAQYALSKERSTLIAKGVARYLIRRSLIFVANEQDESLGAIADFGCFIANALTEADTRSWETLPYSIDLAHFETNTGMIPFTLKITGPCTPYYIHKTLCLKEGDLCIINIFNKTPYFHTIHIPKQFLI
ncbi:MAG: hypothetical protein P4L16_06695 [Chlamydiales bacterium]|nr:hypothetical protein [Chlamydiales bacterium]